MAIFAAQFLQEAGCKIIAVSDRSGAYSAQQALDLEQLVKHKQTHGALKNAPGLKPLPRNASLLELPCELLIPAATEGVIHAQNVANIQAKIIVEGANGPIAAEADAPLFKRGIVVVPDILANAGGVIVSYLEWVQNNQGDRWALEEVFNRETERLDQAFDQVMQLAQTHKVSLRTAAYQLALKRLAQAYSLRGRY